MDPYMSLRGVTVEQFRRVLLEAVAAVSVVRPVALRDPIDLWLRSVVEQSARENWKDLLSRNVVGPWEAARAILAAREEGRRQ